MNDTTDSLERLSATDGFFVHACASLRAHMRARELMLRKEADRLVEASACYPFLFVLAFLTALACLPLRLLSGVTNSNKVFIPSIACAVLGMIAGLFHALMPSSKTVALMVVVPAIVNSQPVQKDLPEIYNAGIQMLKEKMGVPEVAEKALEKK